MHDERQIYCTEREIAEEGHLNTPSIYSPIRVCPIRRLASYPSRRDDRSTERLYKAYPDGTGSHICIVLYVNILCIRIRMVKPRYVVISYLYGKIFVIKINRIAISQYSGDVLDFREIIVMLFI